MFLPLEPHKLTVPKPTRGRAAKPKPPEEVEVVNVEPLQVEIADEKNGKASSPIVTKSGNLSLPPRTTEQQDVVSEGQRKTAWLWERTQAVTAIVVTTIAVLVLGWLSISPQEPTSNQLVAALQLNVMATLILANYFARTNHSKGGSGVDSDDKYTGR